MQGTLDRSKCSYNLQGNAMPCVFLRTGELLHTGSDGYIRKTRIQVNVV